MVEILKSLTPRELATVLMVLGFTREVRLLVKLILQYKLLKDDKRK